MCRSCYDTNHPKAEKISDVRLPRKKPMTYDHWNEAQTIDIDKLPEETAIGNLAMPNVHNRRTLPLDEQDKSLELLFETVDDLESALYQLLTPAAPEEKTVADGETNSVYLETSPLRERLELQNLRIRRVVFRIQDITHRLEV